MNLRSISLSAGILLAGIAARAEVKLPALIGDNMVLMQEVPANVWGWAAPQEKVTVKLGAKTAEAVADAEGHWSVKLEGLAANPGAEMTITGQNSLTVKNVAVGEVWVASGQSNMEMQTARAMNAPQEAAAADFPDIRMFTVTKAAKGEPQNDFVGKWEICTPQTVGNFSAVGYFFARHLVQNLKLPIGIIHSSWGGTPAEYWTPADVLAADPDLELYIHNWEATKAAYPKAKEAYDTAMAKWKEEAEQAKTENKPPPQQPRPPRGGDDLGSPGSLYNGMIAPLLPYSIRGAIWYQGESNAGAAKLYQRLFPTMIQSWRSRWNVGEFPFLFVQLANYMKRFEEPTDTNWARLREAQLMTLELPHTGMAVAIDVGEAGDIHPKNKQEVGRRLALNALASVYYQDVEYSGPLPGGLQEEEGRLRMTFRFSEGLKAADGGKVKGFAIASEDRKFVWADAEIQGDHVVLSSPQVPKPVAIRYDWADNPEGNLINAVGLPATPFRTDDWPMSAPQPAPAPKPPEAVKAPEPAPAPATPPKQ